MPINEGTVTSGEGASVLTTEIEVCKVGTLTGLSVTLDEALSSSTSYT